MEDGDGGFALGLSVASAIGIIGSIALGQADAPIRGDVNGDGQVNFADVTIVMANWTGSGGPIVQDPPANLAALRDSVQVIFEYDPGENRPISTYVCFNLNGPEIARLLERFDRLKGAQMSGPFPPPQ